MKERYGKLREIGFDFDPTGKRAANTLDWDDGLSMLVRHFGIDRQASVLSKFLIYIFCVLIQYRCSLAGRMDT